MPGGANSLGKATCVLFGKKGWFVGAYDTDVEALKALVEELGAANCVAGLLDATELAPVQAAVARFGERTGFKMDCCYNNSGYFSLGDFGLTRHEEFFPDNGTEASPLVVPWGV